MPKTYKRPHRMLGIWLTRIAEEVKRRLPPKGGKEKRGAIADKYGLSRPQLSIIENGKRDYGVSFLLRVLAGPEPKDDPVKIVLEGMEKWNKLSAEDIDACYLLVRALSTTDQRREMALDLVRILKREMAFSEDGSPDRAHGPPQQAGQI